MERRLRFCRILPLLIAFAFVSCAATETSFAAPQETASQTADGTSGSQSQAADVPAQPADQSAVQSTDPSDQPSGAPTGSTTGAAPSPESQSPPQDQQEQQPQPSNQAPPPRRGFVHDFAGDFLHDQRRMWIGPFRPRNYDTHVMKRYGLPFIIISAALLATDQQTAKWLPNTNNQVLTSSRISEIGAPYTDVAIAGVAYLIGRATDNDHIRETGFLGLEAVADSEFITLVLKEVTQRQRPLQGTRRGGFFQGGDSFPSGHAAGVFAIAAVFSYEYRYHIVVPITAYTLASLVDVSRLGARQHWLSDIFIGSAVGFLVGRYVYKQRHDPNLPGSPTTSKLIPKLDAREQGLGLYWDF